MSVLVFDIGATKTRMAVSSNGVQLGKTHIIATPHHADGAAELIREMKTFAKGQNIQQIGGGIAGTLDRDNGVLLESPNLPEWNDVKLGGLIQKAFGICPVLENDTAVVGLGEVIVQAREGIAVYVTVSTGVNGARYVDGVIDRSTFGFEAGRELIPTRDGQTKSLEDLIGGHALQQRYGRMPKDIDDPAIWRQEAEYLAEGVYNMMLLWSPSVIIIGGSMMRDIPLELVRKRLEKLPQVFPVWPELVPAELGDMGGLYGALELLRQNREA